jgi:hypothetical protein
MTEQDRVLEAISAGHKSARAISKATGLTVLQAKDTITRLRTLNLIEPIPHGGNALYRLKTRCLLSEVWTGMRQGTVFFEGAS